MPQAKAKRRTCILINVFDDYGTNQHGLAMALSVTREGVDFIVPSCEGVDFRIGTDGKCQCNYFWQSANGVCQHTDSVRIAKLILGRLGAN